MSNNEHRAKQVYKKIINHLQEFFIQTRPQQILIDKFRSQITKELKLSISYDDKMSQCLKQYLQDIIHKYIGTSTFPQKLDYLDKIITIMRKIRYITEYQFKILAQQIQKQRENVGNKWLSKIPYIKHCQSLQDFRINFLTQFCDIEPDKVDDLIQQIQQDNDAFQKLKQIYEDFFSRICWEANVSQKLLIYIEDCFSQFQDKNQMLTEETIKKMEKKLGGDIGDSEKEIKINSTLVSIAQNNSYVNDQDTQQRLQGQIKNIEKNLRKFSGLNLIKQKNLTLRLGKFGSLISGFAGTDADLDLTILTNCYVNQTEFLKILVEFLRKQYKQQDRRGSRRVTAEIIHAKIPLIQIKINERGKNDLKIDLIVNNILGVINSKFLKVYSRIKWIKNLGLLVKLWGKSVGLIGKNNLSSYAMILMLIHYLIKKKKVKAILDHRVITNQTPFFEYKRLKLGQPQQFKVYYMFKTEQKDVTIYERVNYLKILQGFMNYYGNQIWKLKNQTDRIITVDLSNDCEIDKECAITIKDPFDKPHNPGRLKIQSQQFLKQKFQDAYNILNSSQQQKIKNLFKI